MPISSRRSFLAAAAAISVGRAVGANDQVNIVVIGVGGRGNDHITEYAKQPDCQIAGVCDVNQASLERAVARVKTLTGHEPKAYDDMRKVFDDKDVDAVSIATPNHWHALAAIWACQAGKDVYVEKPASHNIYEGQRMIEAARKYKRIVQVGIAEPQHAAQDPSHETAARRRHRQGLPGQGPLLQAAHVHRAQARRASARRASTGTCSSVPRRMRPFNEPLRLQLALVLGHRQRRHRQPGRA